MPPTGDPENLPESIRHQTRSDLFPETLWSMVLQAGAKSEDALGQLVVRYEPVVLRFCRGLGLDQHEAKDLSADVFANWVRRGDLAQTDRARGRFRVWLKAALRHALIDRLRKRNCRPEGSISLFLDEALEPVDLVSPTSARPGDGLDREWFEAVVEQGRVSLREVEGHRPDFAYLEPFLLPDSGAPDYAALSALLHRDESTLRSRLSVLRDKLMKLVIRKVGDTCEPAEVKREVAFFFSLL